MNFLSYLRVELRRIFLSRNTWVVAALTLIVPLVGYGLYQPATQLAVTRSGEFIGNPTLAGAIGGVILFALLTLFELDRVHKSGSDKLTDTIVLPVTMYLTRMISVLIAATATGIAAMIMYLPVTLIKVGYLFDFSTYLGCWLLIFLPALWIGSLLAAIFYQVTRRMDMSLVLVIFVAVPCFAAGLHYDFILRWINPDVPFLSDMFGNSQPLRMTAYNRLFWLVTLIGLYMISWLCVRRYGRGILGSLIKNGKKFYKLIVGVFLILFAVNIYYEQPFVSSAAPGYNESMWDYIRYNRNSPHSVYPSTIYTFLEPNLQSGTLKGITTWTFGGTYVDFMGRDISGVVVPRRDEDDPFKMYMQINSGLTVSSIMVNGEPMEFADTSDYLMDFKIVSFDMPYSRRIELVVEYSGYMNIWRADEGSGLFGPVVSPQYFHLASGATVNGTTGSGGLPPNLWAGWFIGGTTGNTMDVVLPKNLTMVTYYMSSIMPNGVVMEHVSRPYILSEQKGSNTWRLETYLMTPTDVYAAEYIKESFAGGNGWMNFYYAKKNRQVMKKYDAFERIKDVYNYCLQKISPLPPSNVSYIQNLGTGEIEFSEDALANQWESAPGNGTYAYQIIQQWWREMVFISAHDWEREESAVLDDMLETFQDEVFLQHGWNANGITEYIAYRYAKENFGEEYAYDNYVKVWKTKASDYYRNFYVRNPEYKEVLPQKEFNLLAQQQQELLYYYDMPLKIWKAAQIVGEDKMDKILSQIYQTAYENRKSYAPKPGVAMSYERYWDGVLAAIPEASRPIGADDEYLRKLYDMYTGNTSIPDNKQDFLARFNLDNVFVVGGLERNSVAGKMIIEFHGRILYRYNDYPVLAYTDFLKTCVLTAEDLELTEEDFKI